MLITNKLHDGVIHLPPSWRKTTLCMISTGFMCNNVGRKLATPRSRSWSGCL